MAVFLYRLTPPRPRFPENMTPAEASAMQQHFAYWGERVASGQALVVGPVLDTEGNHGLAILKVDKRAVAEEICAADPVVSAGLGFTYKLYDMPSTLLSDAVSAPQASPS